MQREFRNILVVRTDRIGDVVLTFPALEALRKRFPSARISMLVSVATEELVRGNPLIDEVLVDDRRGMHRGWRYLALVREIRRKKFDLAVIFHTKKRSNLLCFLAGIPCRWGYQNDKFGFLLTHPVPDSRHLGLKHEAQYCLDLLTGLGVQPVPLRPRIIITPQAEVWSEAYWRTHNLDLSEKVLAIHPGASCPTKRWPSSYFIDLIHRLGDRYPCDFILVGGLENRQVADEILNASDIPVLDLTGQTTVGQLAAVLRRCHVLISNDSGPVHVADGVGTAVISIFTRNQPGINPERWRPLGERSSVLAPPVRRDISFARGVVTDQAYLESVKVEDVLEAVDALFKLC